MNKLKRHLETSQLTASGLAVRLGVWPSTITRILHGTRKPSLDLARKIARETGIPLKALRPDIFETPLAGG